MTPDAWMPYYGSDFEGAMKCYRREVKWSYLAALWHYWHHWHCEGLPNDECMLQLLCECPDAEWMRTKGIIFGGKPFFFLEAGKWHQSRCKEEYDKTARSYEAKRLAIAKARESNPNNSTDDRTDNSTVSSPVICPKPQSQSQSQSEPQQEPKNISAAPQRFIEPSLDEVKLQAAKIGLPNSEAEKFHAFYGSKGWKVGKTPMKDWHKALSGWKLRWQESGKVNNRPVIGTDYDAKNKREADALARRIMEGR